MLLMLMKILWQTSEVPQVDDVQTAAAVAAAAPEDFVATLVSSCTSAR